jgi:hypothetical protein
MRSNPFYDAALAGDRPDAVPNCPNGDENPRHRSWPPPVEAQAVGGPDWPVSMMMASKTVALDASAALVGWPRGKAAERPAKVTALSNRHRWEARPP